MTALTIWMMNFMNNIESVKKTINKRKQNFKVVKLDSESNQTINLSGSTQPIIITKEDKIINIPVECKGNSWRVEIKVSISDEPLRGSLISALDLR